MALYYEASKTSGDINNKYISALLEKIRQTDYSTALEMANNYAIDYINNVDNMRVFPSQENLLKLKELDTPLDKLPQDIDSIVSMLHNIGSPNTVAQTGGRYFGFVCGGILPSALASKYLTDAWDQNPALFVLSPIGAKIEEVTQQWLVDLLGLPSETIAGFVSGSSTATIIGLTTGRNYLLDRMGYDVSQKGLFEAPQMKVVVGEGAHSSIYKALSIIGLGNKRIHKVPCDDEGRIIVAELPELDDTTLLILQAGNVNTGSFDDFASICSIAKKKGCYIHIDGAFGLWAKCNPEFSHLTNGLELADSWSVDGHKTLNTPYDNGIILCRHKESLANTMHSVGSYIILSEERDNMLYTTEMSRRTRAIDLWATLMGLGKQGVSELVWELHKKAVYFATLLKQGGLDIVNTVVFNQVLVHYESDILTDKLIKAIQDSGVCWLGGAKWKNRSVMRISVSSYKTTYEDIDVSVEEILRLANNLKINKTVPPL